MLTPSRQIAAAAASSASFSPSAGAAEMTVAQAEELLRDAAATPWSLISEGEWAQQRQAVLSIALHGGDGSVAEEESLFRASMERFVAYKRRVFEAGNDPCSAAASSASEGAERLPEPPAPLAFSLFSSSCSSSAMAGPPSCFTFLLSLPSRFAAFGQPQWFEQILLLSQLTSALLRGDAKEATEALLSAPSPSPATSAVTGRGMALRSCPAASSSFSPSPSAPACPVPSAVVPPVGLMLAERVAELIYSQESSLARHAIFAAGALLLRLLPVVDRRTDQGEMMAKACHALLTAVITKLGATHGFLVAAAMACLGTALLLSTPISSPLGMLSLFSSAMTAAGEKSLKAKTACLGILELAVHRALPSLLQALPNADAATVSSSNETAATTAAAAAESIDLCLEALGPHLNRGAATVVAERICFGLCGNGLVAIDVGIGASSSSSSSASASGRGSGAVVIRTDPTLALTRSSPFHAAISRCLRYSKAKRGGGEPLSLVRMSKAFVQPQGGAGAAMAMSSFYGQHADLPPSSFPSQQCSACAGAGASAGSGGAFSGTASSSLLPPTRRSASFDSSTNQNVLLVVDASAGGGAGESKKPKPAAGAGAVALARPWASKGQAAAGSKA